MSEGLFPEGIELMLWNPLVDAAQLRWLAVRSALISAPMLWSLGGTGLLARAVLVGGGLGARLLGVMGVVVVAVGILAMVVDYHYFQDDHRHSRAKLCRLDRARGEFYFRPNDFADLPGPMPDLAHRIIAAVAAVHVKPAAAWLDHGHLREIHQIAWDALHILDATRSARDALLDAEEEANLTDLRSDTQNALSEIDRGISEVLLCLLQSVELTRAWTRKLQYLEARRNLREAHDALRAAPILPTVQAAAGLPATTFAYITAARDILAAGSFPWEQLHTEPTSCHEQSCPHVAPSVWLTSTSAPVGDRDAA